MKKSKVILIVIGSIIFLALIILLVIKLIPEETQKPTPKVKTQSLMDYGDYKNINADNINKITVIRYTEGGASDKVITDKQEMTQIYNYLRTIKIGKETKMACEDNTTVYSFELKDNTKQSVEIECDWVVIKDKRFSIK